MWLGRGQRTSLKFSLMTSMQSLCVSTVVSVLQLSDNKSMVDRHGLHKSRKKKVCSLTTAA